MDLNQALTLLITRNFVPQEPNEGTIGTYEKPWGMVRAKEGIFDNLSNVLNVEQASKEEFDTFKTFTQNNLTSHSNKIISIFAAVDELVQHTENTNIHVTLDDKAAIYESLAMAQEALVLARLARDKANQNEVRIIQLESGIYNNLTGNPFSVTFKNLYGISVIKGLWNQELQRIEC